MKKLFTKLLILGSLATLPLSGQINSTIDLGQRFQEMDGFGAFGARRCEWCDGDYSTTNFVNYYLDDLGISMIRMPIPPGFEMVNDNSDAAVLNLNGFNMTNGAECQSENMQLQEMLGYLGHLKVKKQAGADFKVIWTSWSAPHWMKWFECIQHGDNFNTQAINWNKVSNGVGPFNNFREPDLNPEKGGKPNLYPEFAEYFAGFYKKLESLGYAGDLCYAISIQNESAFNEPYASTVFDSKQYRDALIETGKRFEKEGIKDKVKLFGAEDMTYTPDAWLTNVLKDPEAGKYLDVFAVHGYTDGIQADLGKPGDWMKISAAAVPAGKKVWMTETSGPSQNWDDGGAWGVAKAMMQAIRYGAISGWTYWMTNGHIFTANGDNYTTTKIGNVHKQYAKYVRPGAIRVFDTIPDAEVLSAAFFDGHNSRFTYIIVNNGAANKSIKINQSNLPSNVKVYRTSSGDNASEIAGAYSNSTLTLTSKSITSLVFQGTNKAPTLNKPVDVIILNTAGPQKVSVTGVTDGDNGSQTLTVTATSSNTAVVNNTSVTKNGSNYDANFSPVPGQKGTIPVKVTVTDNGSSDIFNSNYIDFNVKVLPFINAAPVINTIPNYYIKKGDVTKKTINLDGLADGNDGSQNLTITTSTSNTTVIRTLKAAYVKGGVSNISFYGMNVLGEVTVTISIQDDGGADLGGKDTKITSFKVIINETGPSGIDGINSPSLSIYPNPAQTDFTVVFPGSGYNTLKIINQSGVIVSSSIINDTQIIIQAKDWEKGLYFVIAEGDAGILKSKIVIE